MSEKTKYAFSHPLHPAYKVRIPRVSLPKAVSISPNRYYRKLMAVAIHANSMKKPARTNFGED